MATLSDNNGTPVDTGVLDDEIATSHVSSVRSPYRESVASSLTPSRLAELMVGIDEGDIESYLTLAEEMEERDLHYRSVLSTRKLAISGSEITVEAASEDARHEKHAEAVRRDLVNTPHFPDMVFDVVDALGKGFSVVEILWDTRSAKWKPRGYRWRPQRFFKYDYETMSVLHLRDESKPIDGVPLKPFKFIQHVPKLKSGLPVRGGLARIAATAYMLKSFTIRDWHVFMEVFGMPLRVGKYGAGASQTEIRKLKRAVMDLAVDGAGVMPDSMAIEFIETARAAGGEKLFSGAADWWDRQVSKGVLGQTMTSDDGSSLAQAKIHKEVQEDLLAADNRQASATLNRDLVKPYIDLNFGEPDAYPRIKIASRQEEDLEKEARTTSILVKSGMRIPASWARERFGIPEVQGDEEVLASAPALQPTSAPPQSPGQVSEDDGAEALNRRIQRLERALNARSRKEDTIDELAAQHASGWEPLLEGSVGRAIKLAENASSFDALLAAMDSEKLDTDELTSRLAVALFEARGHGDATDDPQR